MSEVHRHGLFRSVMGFVIVVSDIVDCDVHGVLLYYTNVSIRYVKTLLRLL